MRKPLVLNFSVSFCVCKKNIFKSGYCSWSLCFNTFQIRVVFSIYFCNRSNRGMMNLHKNQISKHFPLVTYLDIRNLATHMATFETRVYLCVVHGCKFSIRKANMTLAQKLNAATCTSIQNNHFPRSDNFHN